MVFASNDPADLSLLSSSIHYLWATAWGSSLKGDLRYTPSDVYETFPLPCPLVVEKLATLGSALRETQSAVMHEHKIGLTKLYNKFHDPSVKDGDIDKLREAHTQLDLAVVDAYGWRDLDLEYEFQMNKQGTRRIFRKAIQEEILDRLLELNHARDGEVV